MPTIPTPFRAWKPAIDLNQFSPVPLAFIGKLANQFAPTRIANGKSKFMVLHHIFDSQILNHYRLVFTNQLSRQLMQKVFPSIGNLCVDFSHFQPRLMSIVAPFLSCCAFMVGEPDRSAPLFAGKSLLHSFQLLAKLFKVLGVGNLIAIAGGNQAGYANIQSNLFIRFWQLSDVGINQQRCKPTTTSFELDGDSRWFTSCGQISTPANRQCFGTFSQKYLTVSPSESRLCKFSTTATMLLLEVGIFRPSSPEVGKRLLEVSQSLLKWYRANIFEKVKVFLLFQPVSMEEVSTKSIRSLRSYHPQVLASKALLYTSRTQPIVRRKSDSCSVVG